MEWNDIYQAICFSFPPLIKGHFPNFLTDDYILDKVKEMSVTHVASEIETISVLIRNNLNNAVNILQLYLALAYSLFTQLKVPEILQSRQHHLHMIFHILSLQVIPIL